MSYIGGASGGGGSGGRTLLTGNASYYVNASTGSDSNPGTALLPFATLQFAWDHLTGTLDLAEFQITINLVGAGPYTLQASSGWVGGSFFNIIGAGSTVTTINDLVLFEFGMPLGIIDSVNLADTGSGSCMLHQARGKLFLGGLVGDTMATPENGTVEIIEVLGPGAILEIDGTFTVNAAANVYDLFYFTAQAYVFSFANIIFAGSPGYLVAIWLSNDSTFTDQSNYSGAATGKWYFSSSLSVYDNGIASNPFTGDGLTQAGGVNQPASPPYSQDVETPSTGDTLTIRTNFPILLLNPAGALSTLTINLPDFTDWIANVGGFAVDGFTVEVSTTQAIAALTVATTDGSTVLAAPSALTAGNAFSLIYDSNTNAWYPTANGAASGGGGSGRTLLTADATYYVNASTGSDSNDGLTTGTAWATAQYAINTTQGTLDGGGFGLTINFAGAGPYTADVENGWVGFASVLLLGAGSAISEMDNLVFGYTYTINLGCPVAVDGFTFKDTGIGSCVANYALGVVSVGQPTGTGDWACGPSTQQLAVSGQGCQMQSYGTGSLLAGSSGQALYCGADSFFYQAAAITLVGTPTYQAFAWATQQGLLDDGGGYTGSATGLEFFITSGGRISQRGGFTYPGDAPGVIVWDEYETPIGSFPPDVETPLTGATLSMSLAAPILAVEPAGALLALTINLPPIPASLPSGYVLTAVAFVSITQAITTLTIATTDGNSIVGAPSASTLPAGSGAFCFAMIFNFNDNKWHRLQ